MAKPQPLSPEQERRLAYLQSINMDYDEGLHSEMESLFTQRMEYEKYEAEQAAINREEKLFTEVKTTLEEIKTAFVEKFKMVSDTSDVDLLMLLEDSVNQSINILSKYENFLREDNFKLQLKDLISDYYHMFSIIIGRGLKAETVDRAKQSNIALKNSVIALSLPLVDFFLDHHDIYNTDEDIDDPAKIIIGFYTSVSSLKDYLIFAAEFLRVTKNMDYITELLTALKFKLKEAFKDEQDIVDKFIDVLARQPEIENGFNILDNILNFSIHTKTNVHILLRRFIHETIRIPDADVSKYIDDLNFIFENVTVNTDGNEPYFSIREIEVDENMPPLESVMDDASARETWKKEIDVCVQIAAVMETIDTQSKSPARNLFVASVKEKIADTRNSRSDVLAEVKSYVRKLAVVDCFFTTAQTVSANYAFANIPATSQLNETSEGYYQRLGNLSDEELNRIEADIIKLETINESRDSFYASLDRLRDTLSRTNVATYFLNQLLAVTDLKEIKQIKDNLDAFISDIIKLKTIGRPGDNKWKNELQETYKFYFHNSIKSLLNSDDVENRLAAIPTDNLAKMHAIFLFISNSYDDLAKLNNPSLLESFEVSVDDFFRGIRNNGRGYDFSAAAEMLISEIQASADKLQEKKSAVSFFNNTNVADYKNSVANRIANLREQIDLQPAGPSAAASSTAGS